MANRMQADQSCFNLDHSRTAVTPEPWKGLLGGVAKSLLCLKSIFGHILSFFTCLYFSNISVQLSLSHCFIFDF